MLQQDDLATAVVEGILTDVQATALRDLAQRREKERIARLGHEERFRFMRGFNDFFFAVGVLLLASGLMFFAGSFAVGHLFAAAIVWALAELLVRRMRLVLPGILLAALFVVVVYAAASYGLWTPESENSAAALEFGSSAPLSLLAQEIRSLTATAAAFIFYLRFRLPFSLLLVAAGLVLAVMTGASSVATPWALPVLLLICGLGVFSAAMWFDCSDPERTTRRSDCAFWLHLLAAPLIVHSLVSIVAPSIGTLAVSGTLSAAIVAIVALLAVVAVVIDRRALFVSALTYLGIVIAYAINKAGITPTNDFSDQHAFVLFTTLLILGILVLTLGVGWLPLRRHLIVLIPAGLTRRLPPVVSA